MKDLFSFHRLLAMMIKELIQLRRDRLTFAMMIGIPIIQMTLFGFAINGDPRRLPTAVVVQEQMTMVQGSWGSASVDAANSVVSRMTVDRHVRVLGGRLVVDEPSLLERIWRQERVPTE